ncbi:MAG: hypothetical protein ACYDCL_09750 [Myxococcales bacterium]
MRRALLSLVALAAGCSLPSDNPTSVHDLRILAISATPPELRYAIHGNYQQGQCNPDLTGVLTAGPIQLQALVADPNGGGRDLGWTWTECPQTSTERCPSDPAYVIASGSGPPSQVAASFDVAAEALGEEQVAAGCASGCPPTPLLTAIADNPLGFCRFGIWLQVGLEIDTPDAGSIYGSKLLVFTPVPDDYPTDAGVCPQGPDGGMPPHQNPVFSVLDLDGNPLPAGSAVSALAAASHALTPVIPSNGEQPYCVPNFQGGWTELTETWLFSLMTTVGTFDTEQVGAGGFGNVSGGAINLTVDWSTPADGGAATIYSVVRDGRGGTSWITRQVDLQSPP